MHRCETHTTVGTQVIMMYHSYSVLSGAAFASELILIIRSVGGFI